MVEEGKALEDVEQFGLEVVFNELWDLILLDLGFISDILEAYANAQLIGCFVKRGFECS